MDLLMTGATGYTGSGSPATRSLDSRAPTSRPGSWRGEALGREGRHHGYWKLAGGSSRGRRGRARRADARRGIEEAERTVVGAVLDALWGTGRTFVYNSGVWSWGTRQRA